MSTNAYHTELREGISTAQPSPPPVDEVAGDEQAQNSKLALDFKENGLPFADAFKALKKTKTIEDKIAASKGEALGVEDFQQLMKDNGVLSVNKDDSKKKTTEAEAIIKMFTKQSEIMEKYTKHLELLEKQTKEPEPVEAVTAMIEQTHIQTDAILSTVQKEEDDFPEELQQQLETVLSRTEEALERLMRRLKRKAATGQVPAKAAAPEVLSPTGPSGDKL
ncbi:MAG: hypothetical protein Q9215_003387 [Flavoplaca cf. flavocitrina]